ncbi:penicillin-binding transpeptidase domain-containing protein [Streptomyces sp. VRA16 Mangrove soil]|uniref:penicillin-binding transpeptidase domain-containing protein n=1 Tax=Streptomyces sp. VRA16 Mangrove soil TaxID=2817434 RepID=UPI001A9D5453|nr:penicillin-binding transpeptidase domain-containing protein [Streptomyces sp. VRA16 Mangrove soil]MBO1336513.1 penicillin-binding protein [Streptomyces sp. VRA16 Mangrove soil]
MRRGVKIGIVGGVFTVMVGGAGYGAYNIVTAVTGGGDGTTLSGSEAHRTGPPSSGEIKETATKFLAAWEKNDPEKASSFTNNATDASALLTDWHDKAHVTHTVLTAGSPVGAKVPFKVKATVSYHGKSRTMTYDSALTVVRGQTTGRALVDWLPAVVHPAMEKGDDIVTGESAAPAIEAVDRSGAVLTAAKYPSLGPVLDDLRAKYGERAGGSAGVETYIQRMDADGTETTAKTLLTLAKGKAGKVRTTLSASVQAVAEQQVNKYPKSSVVALRPTTGEVLAVANQEKGEFNGALSGGTPPGSVMKIVTAAGLLDNGVVSSMNGPAPCPDSVLARGQTFHNLQGLQANENATLADSFSRSCNTAFIKLYDDLKPERFVDEATNRFGLGKDWKTGIASRDGSVQTDGTSNDAASVIGQGLVKMNPLNMASVTATAITGTFHQPVIVPQSIDGRRLATAQGLRPGTATQLRQMMRITATSGTARVAMASVPGYDKGAKTGSAEVDGQGTANSWFAGFRGNDIAAAATVERGGHGGDAAGPIVAAILRSGL